MGQRLATLAAACAVAAVATAAAAGSSRDVPNWAAPQIATVVAHKLMGARSVKKFHPNAALTRQTLSDLSAGLKEQLGAPLPSSGSESGSSTEADSSGMGRLLGLSRVDLQQFAGLISQAMAAYAGKLRASGALLNPTPLKEQIR